MSDELRMDLADCGSPEALIAVILKHHPQLPRRVPVRELAASVGIIDFKELETENFEGALRTDFEKTKGVILTKAGAREERVRFTIGHELGHFLIPSHKGIGTVRQQTFVKTEGKPIISGGRTKPTDFLPDY